MEEKRQPSASRRLWSAEDRKPIPPTHQSSLQLSAGRSPNVSPAHQNRKGRSQGRGRKGSGESELSVTAADDLAQRRAAPAGQGPRWRQEAPAQKLPPISSR